MKIKDLGIIDITWIDAQIDFLKHNRDKMGDYKKLEMEFKIEYLESLKRDLIPAEKLAEIAYDAGVSYSYLDIGKEVFLNRDIIL